MAKLVRFLGLLAIGLALATGPAMAAGGGSKAAPPDPNYAKARALIDAGSYGDAIPFLEKAVTANPKSADAYNYLGYSHRKIGQIDAALENYRRALELQPKHLGANEYLGELYLETNQIDKAVQQLQKLDDICRNDCKEYSTLKKAIDSHQQTTASNS